MSAVRAHPRLRVPRSIGLALCAAIAAVALQAALPAIASASITNVYLTPGGAVEPGQHVTAHVTTSGSPPNQSVSLMIDGEPVPGSCTAIPGGTTGQIPFVAPHEPGEYTLSFSYYHGTATCTAGSPGAYTLQNALRVDEPAPNPPIPGENPNRPTACGTNVTLVLDESDHAAQHEAMIRAGALAFLHHLSGTGAHVAIVVFSGTARVPELGQSSPELLVDDTTIADVFTPYIDGQAHGATPGYNPNLAEHDRNWAAALDAAQAIPHAPLVTFITAGNPTTPTTGGSSPLFHAVEAANTLKTRGSHIFAAGVGTDVDSAYLKDISGEGDFDITHDLAGLSHDLLEQILHECRSSLTVTKLVNNNDGKGFQEAAGWTISATMTHTHSWLHPPDGSKHGASLVTDAHGTAHFQWHTGTDTPEALTVHEAGKHDYAFTSAECRVEHANGGTTETTFHASPASIHVARTEYATCALRNTRTAAPPGPPGPPPECGDYDSGLPECPSTGAPPGTGPGGTSPGGTGPGEGPGAAETTLSVHKTMPRHVHVGERVPVTITVRNTGTHTAHDVTVHESPPGAGRIVHVSGAHATRHHDGTVTWHLGSVAPGHSKTVHAEMLITHGGHLQNTVAVDAPNADVAVGDAVDSVPRAHRPARRHRHHPPRFTG